MKAKELKALLKGGALTEYGELYADIEGQTNRFLNAIDKFTELYGEGREIQVFSVPGRTEVSGNHTDHNRGCVIAGAIDRDIIAVVSKNDDGIIRFTSECYGEMLCDLSKISDPENFEDFTSEALIAGLCRGFQLKGYSIGGYDAYSTSEVLKGSGISSSAAFEVMIGNILNHTYCNGLVENSEIAKLSQYAENVFFGKPCGLMDQMACAVGGFVYIDFEDCANPIIDPIEFSLSERGYSLCIVNTGGSHANLNDDYASIPLEMNGVAAAFGKEALRGISEAELTARIPDLRQSLGDRAILRAIHFIRENARVRSLRVALKEKDLDSFLSNILESGRSSFQYLQNIFTPSNVREQGLSLALALADGYLNGKGCAYRVHGGGFAGTIQVFIKDGLVDGFCTLMDSIFGKGAAIRLKIRPIGACKLF